MERSEELSLSLDKFQWEAVQGPILAATPITIQGGDGTGKTRALVGRAVHLLDQGADPQDILYFCFNPGMALEFRKRLDRLPQPYSEMARRIYSGTPEQWALDVLRLYRHPLDRIPPQFIVWDRAKEGEAISHYVTDRKEGTTLDSATRAEILDWNSRGLALGKVHGVPPGRPHGLGAIAHYNWEKREANALGIDELIPRLIQALEQDPSIWRVGVGNGPCHLLLDGVQDATEAHHRLLDRLGHGAGSITATRDPNQALSSLPGGDPLDPWPSRSAWNQEVRHLLRINHRAGPRLGDAARKIATSPRTRGLEDHYSVSLRYALKSPPVIKRFYGDGDEETRNFLLQQLYDLHVNGSPWEEMAVVCRDPADVAQIKSWLATQAIPCVARGELPDPPDPQLRRITGVLTSVLRPLDIDPFVGAFEEAGVSPTVVRQLKEKLQRTVRDEQVDLFEAARTEMTHFQPGSGTYNALGSMIEAREELDEMLSDGKTTLTEICRRIPELLGLNGDPSPVVSQLLDLSDSLARVPGETQRDQAFRLLDRTNASLYPGALSLHEGGVVVTTVQAARGLEWRIVFFLDAHVPQENRSDQEENRIRYTGLTRASERLFYLVPMHRAKRSWPDPWLIPALLEHPDVDLDVERKTRAQERATKPEPAPQPPQPSGTAPAESDPVLPLTERAGNFRAAMDFIDRYRNPAHPDPIDPKQLKEFARRWFIEGDDLPKKETSP